MARRTVPVLLALSLALFVAPACGGDDELSADEFEQRIMEAQDTVQNELAGLRDVNSAQELQSEAEQAADALRDEADDLENVQAPTESQAAQDRLVGGIRTLADQLEQQSQNVGDGDVQAFLDQLGQLSSADIEGALQDLRDAGIDIPTIDTPRR